MFVDNFDLGRVVKWVQDYDFQRIALQCPDGVLMHAPIIASWLQRSLPNRKLFVLGDSTYGSSTVDEVGADHYGADCIVHFGPSDQTRAGTLPVLYMFGRERLDDMSAAAVVSSICDEFRSAESAASILLVCDVSLQHAMPKFAAALGDALPAPGRVLVAEPHVQVAADLISPVRWRDWRFGVLPLGHWWASLGFLAKAAVARPEALRVCGRLVRRAVDQSLLRLLPDGCGLVYVGVPGSALERRILLRHGTSHPVWRLEPAGGALTRLSSTALLMQRYRFVELVKSAAVVGLLLCTTGTLIGQAVADRLEYLLRRSGRRVYRFVIGKISVEKLGNFPGIECYVSLAGPEHFPYDVRDLHVPIASPYELEVALGAREWDDYITDCEELLHSPLPPARPSDDDVVPSFGSVDSEPLSASLASFANKATKVRPRLPPAEITAGLHGVPSHYSDEPS